MDKPNGMGLRKGSVLAVSTPPPPPKPKAHTKETNEFAHALTPPPILCERVRARAEAVMSVRNAQITFPDNFEAFIQAVALTCRHLGGHISDEEFCEALSSYLPADIQAFMLRLESMGYSLNEGAYTQWRKEHPPTPVVSMQVGLFDED